MFPYRKLLNLLEIHVMPSQADSTIITSTDSSLVPTIVSGNMSEAQLLHYKELFFDWLITAAGNILGAIVIFIVGRFIISIIMRMLRTFMTKRHIEASLSSFISSMVNVLLIVLLLVSVVNKLGIETTSFAALLASIGLAVGMAFSGNLQNFASGVIILLMRPYKVGDIINVSLNLPVSGVVESIQIFHTIIKTYDANLVFVPNNMMMNNALVNATKIQSRLIEMPVSIDYGQDFAVVEQLLLTIALEHPAVLRNPVPTVILKTLADSAVVAELRCYVANDDFVPTSNALRRTIYERFNAQGINFPFPQMTVHQA